MVDEQMFDLFTKVIGKKAVSKYVQEWRVFQNNRNDLGAFVELIAGTDKWVVGANQEGFTTNDTQVTQSFANLFVHEYAHILIFEKPGFEEVFKKSFWTNKDINNSVVAEQTSANLRFDILSKYFDNNQSRFVSEYATMNTSEDVAETFVLFVTEPRPTGSTVRDQKILLFYGDSDFVSARTELRTNLRSLGVLK